MTHSTTFFSSPSSDAFVVITNEPQPQEAYISLHKSNQLNAEERRKLLSIMDNQAKLQLCNQYLTELDAILTRMDELHHPAVMPGRQIIADIRRKNSCHASILEMLHHTRKLATTPADSPDFQQTTNDYLQTSRRVNAEANGLYFMGACHVFAAACTIAATIAISVIMGPAVADMVLNAFVYGMAAAASLVMALPSVFLFYNAHTMKNAANNMRAFESAMHEAPAPKL